MQIAPRPTLLSATLLEMSTTTFNDNFQQAQAPGYSHQGTPDGTGNLSGRNEECYHVKFLRGIFLKLTINHKHKAWFHCEMFLLQPRLVLVKSCKHIQ